MRHPLRLSLYDDDPQDAAILDHVAQFPKRSHRRQEALRRLLIIGYSVMVRNLPIEDAMAASIDREALASISAYLAVNGHRPSQGNDVASLNGTPKSPSSVPEPVSVPMPDHPIARPANNETAESSGSPSASLRAGGGNQREEPVLPEGRDSNVSDRATVVPVEDAPVEPEVATPVGGKMLDPLARIRPKGVS